MDKINLAEKLKLFEEYWNPKIIGECNDAHLKLAKLKGIFDWHHHENEDELFFVIKGHLTIHFRDRSLQLDPGELVVIPKGTEHCPEAVQEVHVLLVEPKGTLNTGNVVTDKTRPSLERI